MVENMAEEEVELVVLTICGHMDLSMFELVTG